MLNLRYKYDREPILKLNGIQKKIQIQVSDKINSRKYALESVYCSICGSGNLELLAEKDRYGIYSPTSICKDCGLIFASPRLTESAYIEFYNSEYRKLYVGTERPANAFFKGQYLKGIRIARFFRENGIEYVGKKILEVGCGAGGILKYFRDQGSAVVGCDLGEEYLAFGRKNYDLDLLHGSIHTVKLPFTPDLVIYSHVFEHVLDPNKELERIRALMHHSSMVYIEVPSVKNICLNYDSDFLKYLQGAHTYHFTRRTLKNLLSKNGFLDVKSTEYVRSIFVKGSSANSFESDYSDVLNFLKRMESRRKYRWFNTSYVLFRAKKILIKTLDTFGILNPIRVVLKRN
ncbi:MAG: class I SAM-dependent methyltransferase [Oligoflexales bacterium]